MNYKSFLYYILFFLFASIPHCKQKNEFKQDEDALVAELMMLNKDNENEEIEEYYEASQNTELLSEKRNVDPVNPPVLLDIIKARNDIRKISLMDLYKNVRYIPIQFQDPVDSLSNKFFEFDFTITPNNIIASNFSYGITQFDLQGQVLNQIIKNDFYYSYLPKYGSIAISSEDRNQFIGSKGKIHAIGDQIYFQYYDAPNHKGWLMEYDASPGVLSASLNNNLLEQDGGGYLGQKLFPFEVKDLRGMVSQMGARNLFPINSETWASFGSKMNSSRKRFFPCHYKS